MLSQRHGGHGIAAVAGGNKKTAGFPTVFEIPGSPGRIRTCDTLINSQLRYHCATGELVGARSHKNVIYRIPQTMQPSISTFFEKAASEAFYQRII